MGTGDLQEAMRRMSRALAPGDLDATLRRITAAAVEIIPDVEYASITVKHADGTLETVAPTDDVLCVLDAQQYALQEGPCYEAAVDTVHISSPDLEHDDRFPRYGAFAVERGVRAQAGIRLFDAPDSNGALNLYALRSGAFVDLESLDVLFAHQAATAIAYAMTITNLQQALASRQLIGEAVGMVMERYHLNEERAFAFLIRTSSTSNVKLRDVAEELVHDGRDLPGSPPLQDS
jgi:GAF domain-containing protein